MTLFYLVDQSWRTWRYTDGMTGDEHRSAWAGWVSEATLIDTCSWDKTMIRETLLNGDVPAHFVIELLLNLFQSYLRHHRPYLAHTHIHSPGAAQNPQSAIIYWFTTHRRPLVIQWVSLSVVFHRREWHKMPFHSALVVLLFCWFVVLKCHYTKWEEKNGLLRILRSCGLADGSSVDWHWLV